MRKSYAAGMTDWIWAIADGGRHGDGHDVVDEQRGGGHEAEDRGEVGPGDDVRAAAVRVRPTDLPVRQGDDREQDGDRDRDLDRQEHRGAPPTIRTRRISSVA